MAELGTKEIEVKAEIFRADGTLKSTENHKVTITNERYEQLKKDGMIND